MQSMRFVDFKPVDIHAAPIGHVHEAAGPGMHSLWLDVAEQVFAVLHEMPSLRGLRRQDLARCALAVAFQISMELGGDFYYVPMGSRLYELEVL